MTSNRPYLIRAMHEWLVDNQCTPHLLVDAEQEGVEVPRQHVKDGKIVLNVGPQAVEGLHIGNDEVSFVARFGGMAQAVSIPVPAVLAIYARENGRGMMFGEEDSGPEPDDSGPKSSRPSLKVVK
ncbi:MAG: ClpXP protease specificity-enhancing factor [Gammaproteobacteria bacterium]|jgi:stringent starvation protein B